MDRPDEPVGYRTAVYIAGDYLVARQAVHRNDKFPRLDGQLRHAYLLYELHLRERYPFIFHNFGQRPDLRIPGSDQPRGYYVLYLPEVVRKKQKRFGGSFTGGGSTGAGAEKHRYVVFRGKFERAHIRDKRGKLKLFDRTGQQYAVVFGARNKFGGGELDLYIFIEHIGVPELCRVAQNCPVRHLFRLFGVKQ